MVIMAVMEQCDVVVGLQCPRVQHAQWVCRTELACLTLVLCITSQTVCTVLLIIVQ
jgi:hypothetical protein